MAATSDQTDRSDRSDRSRAGRPQQPFAGQSIIMEPFVTHRGRLAVLDWSDVNTDLIIPARYLKKIERTGFGPLLFADKRYAAGGAPDAASPEEHGRGYPEFPLNDPAFAGATVLVVGRKLRLRLQPRARGLGGHAGRLSRGHRSGKGRGIRRYLRVERLQNGLLVIELTEPDWQSIAGPAANDPAAPR